MSKQEDLAALMVQCIQEQISVLEGQLQRWNAAARNEPVPMAPISLVPNEAAIAKQKRALKKAKKAAIDPAKPKRPQSAYQLFMAEALPLVKAQNPALKGTDVMTLLGHQWSNLSDANKQPYMDKAQSLKDEYQAQMDAYNKKDAPTTTVTAVTVPKPALNPALETAVSFINAHDDSDSSDDEAEKKRKRKEKKEKKHKKQKHGHE